MLKDLSLLFLYSFRLIKSFQNSIKLSLISIKLSFFKWKFAKLSWNVSTFCSFPFIFVTIFWLASGGSAPELSINPIFLKFSKRFLKFSRNFDKILKKLQKIEKFPYKVSKNYKNFIDFLTFFENFWVWKNRKFWFLQCKKVPPKAAWTSSHPRNPV